MENKTKRKNQFRKIELIFIWGMLVLPLLQWLIFWLIVNLSSIKLAFTDARTDVFTFDNFKVFWENLTVPYGTIKTALFNTLKHFLTSLLIINPISMVIAYFLYKKIACYKLFRIVFYLPAIVSSVAMVAVYREVINPGGIIDALLKLFGSSVPPEGWLARPTTATKAILVYTVWTGFGANILLFMGAMIRVPVEMLEAAKLDGCSAFRELVLLILPLILPTISTLVIITCTNIFSSSGPILLFTSGNYETTTISYWIFEKIYGNGVLGGSPSNYNIASCTGLCFTLVGVPIILAIRYLMDKLPTVEY